MGRGRPLIGRDAECRRLDLLLEALRRGESRALVIRGEAGVGKTALLEHLTAQAADCHVISVTAVESEMELAFAALHQLCAPILNKLEVLPAPERDALRTTFGLHEGPVPDRFLVYLAVLGVLAEAAEERPLVCLLDDEHWMDHASAQALSFVARRLGAESVGLVFSARTPSAELAGLPELVVQGLADHDAETLLSSVLSGPVDKRVRDGIIADTNGNPLAVLELARNLNRGEFAGGFGLPAALGLPARIEDGFRRRADALPAEGRRLLLLAASEPLGDPLLMWRAAGRLGIGTEAAQFVSEAGLVEFGARVRFCHPLARSAVYSAAEPEQRRLVHRALAESTDADADPDRRAWHLAEATLGPDEDVAAELDRAAQRAASRGGQAAAAAFYERAAALTREPLRHTERALAAAQAHLQTGAFDAARTSLVTAEAGPLDSLQGARVDLLRGQIAFASNAGSEAPALLLKAARQIAPLDSALARQTYLDAWFAAMFAERFSGAGNIYEVARSARSAPATAPSPSPSDLLLDGLAVLVTEGRAAATPTLRRVARVFAGEEIAVEEGLRWTWAAGLAAIMVWDEASWHAGLVRQLNTVREAGLLVHLPIYVNSLAILAAWRGDFATADSHIAEADAIAKATGTSFARYAAILAVGLRETELEACELIEAEIRGAEVAGQGLGIHWCHFASAVLYNAHGRYDKALEEAEQASAQAPELNVSMWALPELIEAASRTGNARLAADALAQLIEATRVVGNDWALGVQARSRALVSLGHDAEDSYRDAIVRLGRTRMRTELARAHLLYGEWLRRERRRREAREQLRSARDMFDQMGMKAFAERATQELRATGETARKRSVETRSELTAQEAQVAKLARDGLSNSEIGARLFISTYTVQYHMHKVFTKLDITSRNQLGRVLT
jgi:DNA-binding CsgD family transcriptional regulator